MGMVKDMSITQGSNQIPPKFPVLAVNILALDFFTKKIYFSFHIFL